MSDKFPWVENPEYAKAFNEIVLYGRGIPVGECEICGLNTNGMSEDKFICSFCRCEKMTNGLYATLAVHGAEDPIHWFATNSGLSVETKRITDLLWQVSITVK